MSLTFLLIITTVGIMLFGFVIMGQLDNFIGSSGFTESSQELLIRTILLFGEKKIVTDISTHLSGRNISYHIAKEPDVPENIIFFVVLALSDNDMDNLLLCNKAKHVCPDVLTVAKCNENIYKKVFENAVINCILTGHLTPDSVLCAVKGCEPR